VDSLRRFAQQYGVDFDQIEQNTIHRPMTPSARKPIRVSRVASPGRRTPVEAP
jgi:hypothetical protein